MDLFTRDDDKPLAVVLAGPNGAGKSTFFEAFLQQCGLRFINADIIAATLKLKDASSATTIATAIRQQLINEREHFIFETVFSDPVAAKIHEFQSWETLGYQVVLIFIGISGPMRSDERVAMRVSQGGHDVPGDRLQRRYNQSLVNLSTIIGTISTVILYDNDSLADPYRLIARWDRSGAVSVYGHKIPSWACKLPHLSGGR